PVQLDARLVDLFRPAPAPAGRAVVDLHRGDRVRGDQRVAVASDRELDEATVRVGLLRSLPRAAGRPRPRPGGAAGRVRRDGVTGLAHAEPRERVVGDDDLGRPPGAARLPYRR